MKSIKLILLIVISLMLTSCDIIIPQNTPTPEITCTPTVNPTEENITPEATQAPTATPTAEETPVVPTPAPSQDTNGDLSGVTELNPTLVDISFYMAGSYYKGGDGFRDAVELIHVTSSSVLGDQAGNTYGPENLYDFELFTVWCEGRTSLGIGEWAQYRVKAVDYAPNATITKIEIINGYIKTDDLFNDNSMVKKLLVVVDDENWCILNLSRVKQIQQFEVPDIELSTSDEVVIKFVILEAFEGDVYNDTCITAIEFGGTGIY